MVGVQPSTDARFKQLLRSAMQRFSKPLSTPRLALSRIRATSSYPRDITVTVPPQQATFQPSDNCAPFGFQPKGWCYAGVGHR